MIEDCSTLKSLSASEMDVFYRAMVSEIDKMIVENNRSVSSARIVLAVVGLVLGVLVVMTPVGAGTVLTSGAATATSGGLAAEIMAGFGAIILTPFITAGGGYWLGGNWSDDSVEYLSANKPESYIETIQESLNDSGQVIITNTNLVKRTLKVIERNALRESEKEQGKKAKPKHQPMRFGSRKPNISLD